MVLTMMVHVQSLLVMNIVKKLCFVYVYNFDSLTTATGALIITLSRQAADFTCVT